MRRKEKSKILLSNLTNNPEFIEFICYKEDKWLQYSTFEEKIKTFFGSIKKAKEEFKKDVIFNSQNY
jgi:superoxide dismutase